MEELYRYLLVRSAEAADDDLDVSDEVIVLKAAQSDLVASFNTAETQRQRSSLALRYIESREFVLPTNSFPLKTSLTKIADIYRGEGADNQHPTVDVLAEVSAILRTDDTLPDGLSDQSDDNILLKELTAGEVWHSLMTRLRNSIVAIRESHKHARSLLPLVDMLRVARLIENLAGNTGDNLRPGAYMKAILVVSAERKQRPASRIPDEDLEPPEPTRAEAMAAFEQTAALEETLSELMNLPLSRTEAQYSEEKSEEEVPDQPDRTVVSREKVEHRRILREDSLPLLSERTRSTLSELEINTRSMSLDGIVDILKIKSGQLKAGQYSGTMRIANGTKLGKTGFSRGELGSVRKPEWLDDITFVPETTGHVAPAGVGDLLIVKQQLKRYEGGDIAHVENILQGETKDREHRRRRLSETIFVQEHETQTSEERETQTTSRFEMQQQAQEQVQEEFGVDAGVKISASYGPTVDVEANTDFSYKNAKSESHARATSMSKELVERAASKYSEKIREQVTRKLVEEVEETNRHKLDASAADGHIVGIYQWLNKIYEAQIYNYGKRVMYEFMVPEPAAYYIHALNQSAEEEEAIKVPPAFTIQGTDGGTPLSAHHISEYNYQGLVARYNAADAGPPPDEFITVGVTKSAAGDPQFGTWQDSDKIVIPEGYEFFTASVEKLMTVHAGMTNPFLKVEVSTSYAEPGIVPVVFIAQQIVGGSAYVHIKCRRTTTALNAWKNKVWQALLEGHKLQVAEYQEKVAALAAQEGIQIQGRNPHFNRKVERAELKKNCISLLTGTFPSWLNGIYNTIIGPVPKADEAKLQGAYVRFFEQAFEWENMTYLFYPAFWARASKWQELFVIEDVDPLFQDFLRAGYSRVVIPVRPGFEETVEHFRQTGQIWKGGKLPSITDEDYLPLALEMKALLDGPGDEVPVGESWDVLVPTQLVKLRENNDLPRWEKQEDGSWQEV